MQVVIHLRDSIFGHPGRSRCAHGFQGCSIALERVEFLDSVLCLIDSEQVVIFVLEKLGARALGMTE